MLLSLPVFLYVYTPVPPHGAYSIASQLTTTYTDSCLCSLGWLKKLPEPTCLHSLMLPINSLQKSRWMWSSQKVCCLIRYDQSNAFSMMYGCIVSQCFHHFWESFASSKAKHCDNPTLFQMHVWYKCALINWSNYYKQCCILSRSKV